MLLPSEIAKLAAEAGGKTHAEAMKVLVKEFSDWPKGDLADTVTSTSPSMSPDQKKVWKRYQELTKKASTESPMMLPSELARLGKFPAGVSMTIDEVAAVVGDEFKQMNVDPPPEVAALRDEMMGKEAAKRKMPAADMALVVKGKFPNAFVQLSGLFGDGAEDITAAVDAVAGFTGGRASASDEAEAKTLMEKAQKELSKNKSFKVSMTTDILDLPELTIKWAGKTAQLVEAAEELTKEAAISDVDIFLAVKTAKKVGQRVRSTKQSAWMKAIDLGYIQLNGFMYEVTPKGEKFYEDMLAKGGVTRWARVPELAEIEALKVGNRVRLRNGLRGEIVRVFGSSLFPTYSVELPDGRSIQCGPGDILHHSRYGRFEEGPEGAKQFDAWMAKQPQEVQDDWEKYTEENGDKFKTAADPRAPLSLLNQALIAWGDVEVTNPAQEREYKEVSNDLAGLVIRVRALLRASGRLARYEEGQPADPTAEMSPEDAKEWKGNTEKYKDKFTDEESMMDKYQDQLLPSEQFSLLAHRKRSTWKAADVAADIGETVTGPLEADKDEPYMKGQFTQENDGVQQVASEEKKAEDDIAGGIGAEMKGPMEADKDEPYMKGQFTQEENSELSGKVAAEAYAVGTRVKQSGGKEGTVTKAKMVDGKQMYEVKWDGASDPVDRKHADLKPVKTAGQKIYGHLEWLE